MLGRRRGRLRRNRQLALDRARVVAFVDTLE
jgi:hypothetical protein